FSRMIKLGEDVNDLVRTALPLLMVAGISLAISCNFYRSEILDLLYVDPAQHSYTIFGILMVGFLFVSTSYIYGTLLTANNNLRQLNIVAGFTVVLNVTLNLILIPRYHAVGAAISSLSSQAFFAIAQLILTRKILKISMNGDILTRLAVFLALNILAGYLTLFIPGWIPGFLILLSSCLASALMLRLIRPAELLAIVKG
ncbi:MAG: polysaccharide biosynthesis C-terminal domain-containing protein, partial [Bacteroides sp.]|nr:polysaccharide biosynthesis C-terminal domain-containing protein [Bacteroides sp.]